MRTYILILTLFLFNTINARKTIRGIVTDTETNQPIEHLIVIGNVSGKTTVTNSEGRFQINCSVEDTKLVFRHLNYFTREISIDNKKTLNVSMKVASEDLEEIVILNTSIKNEINKVIKASQARFSKNLRLKHIIEN